jgi:hypothetical protein
MSQEVCNKFKSIDNVTVIKVSRLEWVGRVVRVDGTRTVKTLLEGRLWVRRRKGRPRLRWMYDVE